MNQRGIHHEGRGFLLLLSSAGFLLLGSCGDKETGETSVSSTVKRKSSADEIAYEVVRQEELILRLVPALRALSENFTEEGPGPLPEAVAPPALEALSRDLSVDGRRWVHASFGVLSGRFEGKRFQTEVKFEGVAQGESNGLLGVRAKLELIWRENSKGGWQMAHSKSLVVERDAAPWALFEEVLDGALPDAITLDAARRSVQEEITRRALAEQRLVLAKQEYADLADMESTFQYPAVSVVDYDRDGYEDLFVSSRWASAQLLRNRGDDTFVDVTGRVGRGRINCINSALFADFDNDGDADVLLGRSIEPTLYFRNEGGFFREVTAELTDLGRQFFVTGMAAADVNRDGLLDVYLSTYSPGLDVRPIWKQRYLFPENAAYLDKVSEDAHPYFDDRGTANVLLINRGDGRLERSESEPVKLWRKSYQPCWFDADGDGDDDLYVCNDFAPDSFLRNDTPRGAATVVFVDAFDDFFPDGEMAFGMGASVGDYDNDGDLDLFVSNMYSKAGNRIIDTVGKVDPRVRVAARGNFLYRNEAGVFRQAAAADAPETRVGWAFGGQFADFDNDGHLDLYVPSGLYTAPPSVATEVDL